MIFILVLPSTVYLPQSVGNCCRPRILLWCLMFIRSLLPPSCLLSLLLLAWVTVCHAVAFRDPNASPATEPQVPDDPSSNSRTTIWPVDSPAPLSVSTPGLSSSDTSNLTGSLPECNGRLYGRNLRLTSCMQGELLHTPQRIPTSMPTVRLSR